MQLLMQVLTNKGARSDAVEIDSWRDRDGVNRGQQNPQIQSCRSVGGSTSGRLADLGDNVRKRVCRSDVAGHGDTSTMISFLELCRPRSLDIRQGQIARQERSTVVSD